MRHTFDLGEAIDVASMCWENPAGAGVFQSDRAVELSNELLDFLRMKLLLDDPEEEPVKGETWHFEHVLKIDVAIEEMEQLKGRYSDMLLRVQEWSPPTPDHRGLKLFMLEQLSKSIENDCDTLQYQYPKFPDDPLSYKDQEIENAKSDIAYYGRKMLEESKRATESTAWLAKLRESLI